jgi:hypothetical protein
MLACSYTQKLISLVSLGYTADVFLLMCSEDQLQQMTGRCAARFRIVLMAGCKRPGCRRMWWRQCRSWRLLAAVARLVPVNKSAALLIILLLIMENCGALVLIWPFACPGQLQQVKDGAYHGSAAASAAGGGGDNMLYFQQYNCQWQGKNVEPWHHHSVAKESISCLRIFLSHHWTWVMTPACAWVMLGAPLKLLEKKES